MPANPLTEDQLIETQKLRRLFDAWKDQQKEGGNKISQEGAAHKLGFSQGALSQYLIGRIPLNIDVAINFAKLIGCKVGDFSPSLVKHAKYYAYEAGVVDDASKLSPCALRFANFFDKLPERDQEVLITVAQAMFSTHEATPNFRAVEIDEDSPKRNENHLLITPKPNKFLNRD